jgi:RNase adapter protein RapZ
MTSPAETPEPDVKTRREGDRRAGGRDAVSTDGARPPLDVTIITGMSGAGRSEAARVLEDLGFFVIDNLPPMLIGKVTELARGHATPTRYALVVDVRSGDFLHDLSTALGELHQQGVTTRMLYLDAGDEVLVRRYEESRRRHPLSDSDRVSDGINRERALLEPLVAEADLRVDTSTLNVHELRDRLRELFSEHKSAAALQLNVVSFGYKHGLPIDVDLVFDCRFLPNPHWVEELRPLTGLDAPIRDYVLAQRGAREFLDELDRLFGLLLPGYEREGKAYLSIAMGCTGGRHRSVVIAEQLAERLRRRGHRTAVHHRDVERAV